jgi:hypothetical protein
MAPLAIAGSCVVALPATHAMRMQSNSMKSKISVHGRGPDRHWREARRCFIGDSGG